MYSDPVQVSFNLLRRLQTKRNDRKSITKTQKVIHHIITSTETQSIKKITATQTLRRIRMVKSIWLAIKDWFQNADRRDLERYLSQAQNHADLETRMRKWQDNKNKIFV